MVRATITTNMMMIQLRTMESRRLHHQHLLRCQLFLKWLWVESLTSNSANSMSIKYILIALLLGRRLESNPRWDSKTEGSDCEAWESHSCPGGSTESARWGEQHHDIIGERYHDGNEKNRPIGTRRGINWSQLITDKQERFAEKWKSKFFFWCP